MRHTDHPDTMTVGDLIARDGLQLGNPQYALGVAVAHVLCGSPRSSAYEREREIERLLRNSEASLAASLGASAMRRCTRCGTNGDHYCPADVANGDDEGPEVEPDEPPHNVRRCPCQDCRDERDFQGDVEYDRRRDDELTERRKGGV